MFLKRPLLNKYAVLPLISRSKYLTNKISFRVGLIDRRNLHLSNLNRVKMTRNLSITKVCVITYYIIIYLILDVRGDEVPNSEQENHTGHLNNIMKCWKWNVNEIINGQNNTKYAVLILNCKITQKKNFIKHCWNTASLRITVDGGTTHWDRFLNYFSEEEQKSMKNPDLVTGDFDSILEEVLQKYKKKKCKIISTPDQDYTDFTKAVIELNNYCEENKVQMDYALVISQTSGRLDQILGNIQTLHLIKENRLLHDQTKVYIMSDNSLSWLLHPGDHVIDIPMESRNTKGVWCSLIPVGEPCERVTTSGLKWNLDNQQLKFGALISTSNTFDGSEQVKVKCSHTLLWSMKVPSLTL